MYLRLKYLPTYLPTCFPTHILRTCQAANLQPTSTANVRRALAFITQLSLACNLICALFLQQRNALHCTYDHTTQLGELPTIYYYLQNALIVWSRQLWKTKPNRTEPNRTISDLDETCHSNLLSSSSTPSPVSSVPPRQAWGEETNDRQQASILRNLATTFKRQKLPSLAKTIAHSRPRPAPATSSCIPGHRTAPQRTAYSV